MPLVSASGNPGKSKIENHEKSKSRRIHLRLRTKPIRKWARGVAFTAGLSMLGVIAPVGFGQQNEMGRKTAELRNTGQIPPPQFSGQWISIGPEPTVPPPGGVPALRATPQGA